LFLLVKQAHMTPRLKGQTETAIEEINPDHFDDLPEDALKKVVEIGKRAGVALHAR